jgi:hypothetical protein
VIVSTAHGALVQLGETQISGIAPDGSNIVLGEGQAKLMDDAGNSFGLDGGKFEVQADEVVIATQRKTTISGNVDLGGGDFQPAVLGRDMALIQATHIHTSGMPSSPTTPALPPPLAIKNGLSTKVRFS